MNIADIKILSSEPIDRFKLLLQRQHELEKQQRQIRDELREIDQTLVELSGIKVGDTVEVFSNDLIHVNKVHASTFVTDEFCKHPDRVYLHVHGEGSPITASGAPSRSVKHRNWSKSISSVWITLDEYHKIAPRGE